jgi:hypothetical protein
VRLIFCDPLTMVVAPAADSVPIIYLVPVPELRVTGR